MTTAERTIERLMDSDDRPGDSHKYATLILINVCVGQFIVGLDQRALLVALPTLSHTFNTSLTTIQWVLLIYDLILIGLVITVGRLGDLFGRRRIYAGGSILIVISQYFIASFDVDSSIPRIILPLVLSGLGWAIFNSPNQSAILGSVPRDKIGAASGMNTTAARTGGAMGVALSATLFTYGLTAAGLSPLQVESPQSWGASPEIFVSSFNHTVHIVNLFTLLAVLFSAVRGSRPG